MYKINPSLNDIYHPPTMEKEQFQIGNSLPLDKKTGVQTTQFIRPQIPQIRIFLNDEYFSLYLY